MSMITLLDTKNLVRNSSNSIKNFDTFESLLTNDIYTKKHNDFFNFKKMLNNIFELQYNLIFTHYNENTVKKVYAGKIDAYYQHQYLHNNTAIYDEIFEFHDAIESLFSDTNNDKKYKQFLLTIEELIDVLHFAVEYSCLFAEHKRVYMNISKFPDCIYNDTEFKKSVLDDISNSIDTHLLDDNFYYNIDNNKYTLTLLIKVRNIIRDIAFKDWKKYDNNYYSDKKMTDLFILSLQLICSIYIISNSILKICPELATEYLIEVFGNNNFTEKFVKDNTLYNKFYTVYNSYFVYGCYVAKNWVNMQRQIEDPRYTGKDFGKIIGIEV